MYSQSNRPPTDSQRNPGFQYDGGVNRHYRIKGA